MPERDRGAAGFPWETIAKELKLGIQGTVLLRDGDGYESARKVWNGLIDRHPEAVVYSRGTADVVHVLNIVRSYSVPFTVRSGGHSVAGTSVCDGGLVLDLSRMKGIWVDPKRKTVQVQAGVVWGDVDRETQLHGLATTGGLISTTGVAGFTLGGGIGWLSRKYGLACDNLRSAEVVTADGRVLHASLSENPDLFWALRGGGGNFGVVTAMEFQLHEVGPVVYGGAVFYPGETSAELLHWYSDWIRAAPDELSSIVVLTTAPPAPFLPAAIHGKPVAALAMCHVGGLKAGKSFGEAVRKFAVPAADLLGPIPYVALQSMFDPMNPPGLLNYWKNCYLPGLGGTETGRLAKVSSTLPSPLTEVHVQHVGGCSRHAPEGGTAFSRRRHEILINIVAKWTDPLATERTIGWARDLWASLATPGATETYLNFLADATPEAVKTAYGDAEFSRLAALKTRYDPENLFRGTHGLDQAARAVAGPAVRG